MRGTGRTTRLLTAMPEQCTLIVTSLSFSSLIEQYLVSLGRDVSKTKIVSVNDAVRHLRGKSGQAIAIDHAVRESISRFELNELMDAIYLTRPRVVITTNENGDIVTY